MNANKAANATHLNSTSTTEENNSPYDGKNSQDVSTDSVYTMDYFNANPIETLNHLSVYSDLLYRTAAESTPDDGSTRTDPAVFVAKALNETGSKLSEEGKNILFPHFTYTPDDIDTFRQHYYSTQHIYTAGNSQKINRENSPQWRKELDEQLIQPSHLLNFAKLELAVREAAANMPTEQDDEYGREEAATLATVLDYAGQHLAPQNRERLYGMFHYDPQRFDWFRQQYYASKIDSQNAIQEEVSPSPEINGFSAGDVPAPKLDPLEFLTDLQNKVTYHKQQDGSILYAIEDRKLFIDRGPQIAMAPRASNNVEAIVLAIDLAKRKYGGAIELTGSDAFKRKAIEVIIEHDIDVRLKNPAQYTMWAEMLKEYKAKQAEAPDLHLEPGDPLMGIPMAKSQVDKLATGDLPPYDPANGHNNADSNDSHSEEEPHQPEQQDKHTTNNGTFQGVLSGHGYAPYLNDTHNNDSYYVSIQVEKGRTETIWGVDLQRAVKESGSRRGDHVILEHKGTETVTVLEPVYDESKNYIGNTEKEAIRNKWELQQLSTAPALSIATNIVQATQQLLVPQWEPERLQQQKLLKWLSQETFSSQVIHFDDQHSTIHPPFPELTTPNTTVPRFDAIPGTPVLFTQPNTDEFATTTMLFEGNGAYLQGFARISGKTHHVISPLHGDEGIQSLKLYSLQIDNDQIKSQLIGASTKIRLDGETQEVIWNIHGQSVVTQFQPGAAEKFAPLLVGEFSPLPDPDKPKQSKKDTANPVAPSAPTGSHQPSSSPAKERTNKKTYLAVPFTEKDEAIGVGAKWDKQRACWYLPAGKALEESVRKWLPVQQPHNVSYLEAQQAFARQMTDQGAELKAGEPVMDGKSHRVSVTGDKNGESGGKYTIYFDDSPTGSFMNYRTGQRKTLILDNAALNNAQYAALKAQREEDQMQGGKGLPKKHESRAEEVQKTLSRMYPATSPTPYITKKEIPLFSGIITNKQGTLTCIPAMDVQGKIWTAQYINEDGRKVFAKDTTKTGCFHPVGGMEALAAAPVIIIAEGYSTAASIAEARGHATVAAFDCNNLPHVANALATHYPDKPMLIAGDDDTGVIDKLGFNPGRKSATEAAESVGATAVFPQFAPGEQESAPKEFTDFNDLAIKSSLGKQGLADQLEFVCRNLHRQHIHNKEQAPQDKPKNTPSFAPAG